MLKNILSNFLFIFTQKLISRARDCDLLSSFVGDPVHDDDVKVVSRSVSADSVNYTPRGFLKFPRRPPLGAPSGGSKSGDLIPGPAASILKRGEISAPNALAVMRESSGESDSSQITAPVPTIPSSTVSSHTRCLYSFYKWTPSWTCFLYPSHWILFFLGRLILLCICTTRATNTKQTRLRASSERHIRAACLSVRAPYSP
jgi:hypothetical protein